MLRRPAAVTAVFRRQVAAMDDDTDDNVGERLLREIRALGHYPRRKRTPGGEDNLLARRVTDIIRSGTLTAE